MTTANLKTIFGGASGGGGVKLSGLQTSVIAVSAEMATYGPALQVTGLNVTGGMTQLCDITVPTGKSIRITRASLSLGGGATNLQLSFEIDNVFVLEMPLTALAVANNIIIGNGQSGTSTSGIVPSNVIQNLLALERIRIFAYSPTAGASSTLTMYYNVEA